MADELFFIEDMVWSFDPQFYHAKGHRDFLAVAQRCVEQFGWHGVDPQSLVPFCRHAYAANLQTAFSRSENLDFEIRIYEERGRGRYPVTVLDAEALSKPISGKDPRNG